MARMWQNHRDIALFGIYPAALQFCRACRTGAVEQERRDVASTHRRHNRRFGGMALWPCFRLVSYYNSARLVNWIYCKIYYNTSLMFPMKSIKCTCVGCFPFCEPNPTVGIPDFQNCRHEKRFQLDLPGSGRTFLTHRIHGAGIYANIGGILMGSMLPYVTTYSSTMDPSWVIAQTLQGFFLSSGLAVKLRGLWPMAIQWFPLKWGASRSFYELSNHIIASTLWWTNIAMENGHL